MLGSALRDGTAHRQCVFEVFARRLPDGRRYGVVAGTDRLLEAVAEFSFGDEVLDLLRRTGAIDDAAADVPRGLPVPRRHGRLSRGRAVLPVLTRPHGERQFRRCGRPRDAHAVDPQPRLRDRLGRGADGDRGCRPADHRDGLAAHARAGRGGLGACGVPCRIRVDVEPRSRPRGTASRPQALRRTPSRCCTTTSGPRSLRRSPRSASGRRCSSTPTTSPEASSWRSQVAGPELGAVRIDSGDLGVLADHARAQLDALGATGTKIVVSGDLDEFAIAALGAATGRQLRRGHRRGHRLGRADGRHGLQARRGGRPAGRETLGTQGEPRRAQDGPARAQADRHRGRGDRHQHRREFEPAQGDRLLQRPLLRDGAPVDRLPDPRRAGANTCARRRSPCHGTA